ncbi:hypothetical protein L6R52_31370 [Myxococcota bacterium]|nr:hypothetical protein [Myxococcota bacterium]
MRTRLAAAGLASVLLASACLPDPQSVRERREKFDRSALQGSLLLGTTPSNMTPVGAELGGKAKILGYTLDPAKPEPGDTVTVTLYWTAIGAIPEDYQVFVHGDAIGGNAPRIHGDHFPAKGKYPTDVWREGDVVVDPFTIRIPSGYGAKQLGIYVGLYLGNYRVPLTNRGQAEADNENRSRAVTITFE